MKLYLISQKTVKGYDTYDSAVVAANSKEDAMSVHPSEFVTHIKNDKWMGTYAKGGEYEYSGREWVLYKDIDKIKVKYLGETHMPRGVICASFNAG